MLPSSDDLEALLARARSAAVALGKLGTSQNIRPALKGETVQIAREWLRASTAIREAGICDAATLGPYDTDMEAVLASGNTQPRASALRSKLRSLLDGAPKEVVAPLIRDAGSPRQVLSRQVLAAFQGSLTAEEVAYVDEAARCVTVTAHRAAIIMMWGAGVSRLHTAIGARGSNAFNQAVDATVAKKKGHPYNIVKADAKVSSPQELQRTADAVLLVVGMELFGYDLQVYQELSRLLGQRNDSAHPGMAHPTGLDVQQFASKLNDYLFAKVH